MAAPPAAPETTRPVARVTAHAPGAARFLGHLAAVSGSGVTKVSLAGRFGERYEGNRGKLREVSENEKINRNECSAHVSPAAQAAEKLLQPESPIIVRQYGF